MAATNSADRAAAEMAEKMLSVLRSERATGGRPYPIVLKRLGRLADPHATRQQVIKAAAKRSFTTEAVAARIRQLDAPVALLKDLDVLAGSPLVLELALRSKRTATIHAHTVAQLAAKLTGKLQQRFKLVVGRQVEASQLPPQVGWVSDRRPKLFLIEDLQPQSLRHRLQGAVAGPPAGAAVPPLAEPRGEISEIAAGGPDFAARLQAAFDELDRRKGSHNFVSLVDLRRAMPDVGREQFDAGLRQLRLAGRFTLSAAESVHGIQPDQRDAGIEEAGTLLLYLSRKGP
jgi:hypothetical protein